MIHGSPATSTLTQVENGWMVTIPQVEYMNDFYGGPRPMGLEESTRFQAKIMKEELATDPLLDKIAKQNARPEEQPKKLTAKDIKQSGIFVFATLKEALDCISFKLTE